jgi:hypothetical protein
MPLPATGSLRPSPVLEAVSRLVQLVLVVVPMLVQVSCLFLGDLLWLFLAAVSMRQYWLLVANIG